jgi:BlaI family transcriptional regulator, penicillinase repressor
VPVIQKSEFLRSIVVKDDEPRSGVVSYADSVAAFRSVGVQVYDYICSHQASLKENLVSERISDAEHAVMEVLWTESPLAAQDVAGRLSESHNWTLATVKTLLSRLVSKGAVQSEADGRKFLYQPALARDIWVSGESKRLVDRLFGGRLGPLVAQFAEQASLTKADIDEIESLLRELRK